MAVVLTRVIVELAALNVMPVEFVISHAVAVVSAIFIFDVPSVRARVVALFEENLIPLVVLKPLVFKLPLVSVSVLFAAMLQLSSQVQPPPPPNVPVSMVISEKAYPA